jgi:hypothetical protein
MPRRRGRPRKNQEIVEAQISEEPCIRLVAEERLRHAIRLEPAGGSSRKDRRKQGKRISQKKMSKCHSATAASETGHRRALSGKHGIMATTSDKGHRSIRNAGSRREHGMVEKEAQRGTRHHCIAVRSTETDGRKARETFQRM